MADRDLPEGFAARHIGPDAAEITTMLDALGVASLEELIDRAVPDTIRDHERLDLPAPLSEPEALTWLRGLADRVSALDGTLELRSPQGAGTVLRASIPV